MKKNVKRILLGVAVAAAAILGVYTLLAPTQVPMTKVTPKTAQLTFTAQGVVAGERVIQIFPAVQGALLELAVTEGQRVAQGDVICTIDPEPIRQKINQVNSTISGYRAQMASWEGDNSAQNRNTEENRALQLLLIEQSEGALADALRELERVTFLYEDGTLARTDVEQAQAAADQCELALKTRQQELEVIASTATSGQMRDYYQALIDIEQANLALLERELAQTAVTAAADGIITALPAQHANYISMGSPVAELTMAQTLCVETYVSTTDVDSIAPGDLVELVLARREADVTFPGTITRIHDTAELTISALGLEERRVKVEIAPDTAGLDAKLGAGYDIEVRFLLYREEGQLTVPKTALFRDGGADCLWVAENGVLRVAEVTKGMELRTEHVILSGLEAESFVVTEADGEGLRDGLRVALPAT